MIRRGLALALLIACRAPLAPAPASSRSSAQAAAPLPAPTVAAIDRVMQPFTGDRPGCAVGVARRGALVLARGYGLADVAAHRPITPATIFDLGSTSKQFTAAVILSLVADGALALDTPVRAIVPELPARRGRAITIADLLHHTSGLPDYIELLQTAGYGLEDHTTAADALAAIIAAPARPPGVEEVYSNSGYFLLALIAERVSHRSFAALARDRLFTPVGMTHTAVTPRSTDPAAARGYDHDGGWDEVTSGWDQVGDGAVHATIGDLARWAGEFDAPTALAPGLIAALLTRGQLDDGTVLDYAAGLEHGEHDGRATVSHSGAWVGFGAELLRFPDEQLAIICLCNFDDSDPATYAKAIADAIHATP
ncbi:MAG: beta-lactamase family protein [Deltaproteobacteria bacterium]|nr:beta-lactamase family protein [Deltaproteobacteria bacterium]